MERHRRQLQSLLLLPLLLLLSGCPKDPYRAALQGSDGVANGVHSSVLTISQLYSKGVASDSYKAEAAKYLDAITDCNMSFRKAVVSAHTSGQKGVPAYLLVADSFVKCTQQAVPPTASNADLSNALKAVDAAISGVSLAISNAKGGK